MPGAAHRRAAASVMLTRAEAGGTDPEAVHGIRLLLDTAERTGHTSAEGAEYFSRSSVLRTLPLALRGSSATTTVALGHL
ncbi:hypothetical protein GCM10011588_15900 [Nocardia jinanensis]|uniref:Uncharacterized protein n=1 Tax=Nocardia jinanensis TaxID=382504 RepID=A0A917VPP7_9NOCA|nr:hypothetical protein GCM10011588_15900 [Nocardia jinanensis]